MSRDCTCYVKTCALCNQNKKPNRIPRASLGIYHAGFPMERVHVDILGPFTTSHSGNKYILMMCDQFTKWLECAAIPDQSAEKVAKHFLERFITTFGCPLEVHSDQGSNFQSNLFQAMCGALKIAKTRTTPYRPCSNGQVERQNRTVLQMIRCRIQGEVHDWDKDLHLITMALHSTENRSTGFTPNQLMLGREIILPEDLVLGRIQNLTEESSPENWVIDLSERMSQIHCEARKHLRMNQLHQKNDYDLRVNEHLYHPGDFVYLRDHSSKKGRSPKLQSIWKGPFLVVRSQHPVYGIQTRKKEKFVHHDNIKMCEDRQIPLWLRRARNRLWASEIIINPSDIPIGGTAVESLDDTGEEGLSAEAKQTSSDTQIGGSAAESLENVISETEEVNEGHSNITEEQDKLDNNSSPETTTKVRTRTWTVRRPKHLDSYVVDYNG